MPEAHNFCSVKEFCAHANDRCWHCAGDGNGTTLHYKPTSPRAPKHPLKVQALLDKKKAKDTEKREKKAKRLQDAMNGVVDEKKLRGKLAARAEANTEKRLAKMATKAFERRAIRSSDGNSGRVRNDDDHVALDGWLRLDTKNQSKRVNPEISLAEYDECKAKALVHGSPVFGLVNVNKDGRAFVCFDLERDWPQIYEVLIQNTLLEGNPQ